MTWGGFNVASASVINNGFEYAVHVNDYKCDNAAPHWHAHNSAGGYWNIYIPGNPTCGHDHWYYLAYDQIGSPHNWWVDMEGQNSSTYSFPPAP